jgi:saccharopine dehydrogenase-like NADP-dependent oxidoreductase
MHHVLILGAGMVSRPLVELMLQRCEVTLADLDLARAGALVHGHANGRALAWSAADLPALGRLVERADLVVSMLPPELHPSVASICIAHRRHLVTTSYVSPAMRRLDREARERGVLLLNEIGESPGLDLMASRQLVDGVEAAGGRLIHLACYGCGLPAAADVNPMGYKFSWRPEGLLQAARVPAAVVEKGRAIEVDVDELFLQRWQVEVPGRGTFEAHPNRDARVYLEALGVPPDGSLVRGLLRHPGWCDTMHALVQLGLLDREQVASFHGASYRELIATRVGAGSESGPVDVAVARHLGLDPDGEVLRRLRWLGLFDSGQIRLARGSRADVLLELMRERMTYGPGERDLVVVHAEAVFEVEGRRERCRSTLTLEGTPADGHSAMARAVSLPAAVAGQAVLQGAIDLTGVRLPTSAQIYRPVLAELERLGLGFQRSAG